MSLELRYPILQSGFLGVSSTGMSKEIPASPTFSDTILFTPINHEYDNLHYSEDVSKLFIEWQCNFHVIRKFDFKVMILTQAMKLFGPSIGDWLVFQANKPGFSNTHKQYLARMSQWIVDGHAAPDNSAEAIKWISILGPGQGNSVDFNVFDYVPPNTPMSTASAIGNWVSKDSGYESLLNSLYIIFGRRVGHTQKTSFSS